MSAVSASFQSAGEGESVNLAESFDELLAGFENELLDEPPVLDRLAHRLDVAQPHVHASEPALAPEREYPRGVALAGLARLARRLAARLPHERERSLRQRAD